MVKNGVIRHSQKFRDRRIHKSFFLESPTRPQKGKRGVNYKNNSRLLSESVSFKRDGKDKRVDLDLLVRQEKTSGVMLVLKRGLRGFVFD